MATDILGRNTKLGLLQQSKGANHWTAPAAAGANFVTQFYNNLVSIPEPDTQVDQFNIADGGNVMEQYTRVNVDGVSGMPTINFEATATKATIAYHLVSAFQSVSEAVGTPFAKTFTFADTVLDWTNNEGFLFTIAHDTGISGSGVVLENAILNEYNIVINPLARGTERFLTHSGTWMGNEMNFNQTLNGTWSTPAEAFFNDTTNGFEGNLDVTVGATALTSTCFHRFEFQYRANIFSDCKSTGGKANNYKWRPEARWIIDLPYNSGTDAILNSYKAGDRAYLVSLDNGVAIGTDPNLGFANTYGVLDANPFYYEGDYVAVRLNMKIQRPSAGWGTIVTLSDTIDGGY